MRRPVNDGRPFLARDIGDFGFTRRTAADAIATGVLRRVFRGVLVDGTVPDDRTHRLEAIGLVAAPGSVACDCIAAWVMGVDTYRPGDRFDLTPGFLTQHHETRVVRPHVRSREAHVHPDDVMELDGVLLTTPVRTTVDLLRRLRRPYALAAADGMTRAGLVTAQEVRDYIGGLKGYPGIRQARELATYIDPGAESPGESWTRLRLLDAGFRAPTTQIEVPLPSGASFWIDMGYEDIRVGVEYDGVEFHTEEADRAHDDERRDYLTRRFGWRWVIATKDDTLGSDPAVEVAVGALLGRAPKLPRLW